MLLVVLTILAIIPVAHLWLHALLPFWRKHPAFFYAFFTVIGTFIGFGFFEFTSWQDVRLRSGLPASFAISFATIGLVLLLTSLRILGPRRFFLLGVLKPQVFPQRFVESRILRIFPHPAYVGYMLLVLGLLVATNFWLAFAILLENIALYPLVIKWEEKEVGL